MKKTTPKLSLSKETVKDLTLPKDAIVGMAPPTFSDQTTCRWSLDC